ncbi:hypothetical protein [Leifsonia sp. NPDC058230]|uniref:hypothetical protein n=1 Tax=Leifsonia sp. NPDC058230 TaxID=3346391 RepID=UPI0036DE9CD2
MKTGIALVISLVLFLGGLYLMGLAVELPAWQALVFFSGIIAVALSFAIPIHVLPAFD